MQRAENKIGRINHFKRPVEQPVTPAERSHVTFLWGGFTERHGALITAAMRGLGYRLELIPTPMKDDFQTGREYGDNGMCNPAYFTIGALINYLNRLRDDRGLSVDEICRDYAFITAGSCGPCRFGMYESEYRVALRHAGFDGFRVLVFQQQAGINQSSEEDAALPINAQFVVSLLNGMLIADVLNDMAYHIRPYETVPGETDRVMAETIDALCRRFVAKGSSPLKGRRAAKVLSRLITGLDPGQLDYIVDQLVDDYYLVTLREAAERINDIEVDFTRPKPNVKVIGEIWAQTTEGDGNFRIFSYLESHGCEVMTEPLMTWLNYLCDNARCKLIDEKGIEKRFKPEGPWNLRGRLRDTLAYRTGLIKVSVAKRLLNREFERIRLASGGIAHAQPDQTELRNMAEPFFNYRVTGGEGHLEVAKTLYYSLNHFAHLILSVKPFGCLPSTQSDGAQAAVLARYPEINFMSIETSGEGDINAYSRVQMALGDARAAAKAELTKAVNAAGYSLDEIRDYCRTHRELRRPLQALPRRFGLCGTAANFVHHVASKMDSDTGWHNEYRSGDAPGVRASGTLRKGNVP